MTDLRLPREIVPIPPDQPVVVDLGCGPRKRGNLGIDAHPWPGVDLICLLGFEPIPLADGSVDAFKAFDFLEHIPGSIRYREGGRWCLHSPRLYLLREIHRCLKPGGTFESQTPVAPHATWAQDPTHTSPPWVRESWHYFCAAPGATPPPGIDFAFRLIRCQPVHGHLHVVVAKP